MGKNMLPWNWKTYQLRASCRVYLIS